MVKTGMELLEEISEKLELLTRRFEVIEQNTKQILNRLNMTETKQELVEPIKKEPIQSGPKITQAEKKVEVQQNDQKGNTRVMGKIKKENKVLSGVNVKILGKDDTVVRETKTNKSGEWQCFLKPGSYVANYFLDNVIDSKVNINVTSDQQLLRVGSP